MPAAFFRTGGSRTGFCRRGGVCGPVYRRGALGTVVPPLRPFAGLPVVHAARRKRSSLRLLCCGAWGRMHGSCPANARRRTRADGLLRRVAAGSLRRTDCSAVRWQRTPCTRRRNGGGGHRRRGRLNVRRAARIRRRCSAHIRRCKGTCARRCGETIRRRRCRVLCCGWTARPAISGMCPARAAIW